MTTPPDVLRLVVEHVQANTALLRMLVGPALDDAALARAGVNLPSSLDLPLVISATSYPAGTVIRLPRASPRLTVGNLGSGAVRIRVYGAALPAPGQPPDATDPPPTPNILIGAGLTWDGEGILSRGVLVVDPATLQVIAR